MEGKMQTIFEIIGVEKTKDAPLGKKDFNIYHLKLVPVTLVKTQDQGKQMLEQMGFGKLGGLLDKTFDSNTNAFTAEMPVLEKTLNQNGYKLGKHVMIEMYPVEETKNE